MKLLEELVEKITPENKHEETNWGNAVGQEILEEEDVLDWDYYLKDPPFNPSTLLEVEFEYTEKAKPLPCIEGDELNGF